MKPVPHPLALCFLVFISCGQEPSGSDPIIRKVAAATVLRVPLHDEVSGFGSISFLRKVDVSSPQDAVVGRLFCREGDAVKAGSVLARLDNPRIQLALDRAAHEVSQAEATVELARARLFEGRLAAESRILALEKSSMELERARKEFDESSRKQADQETLFLAGGVPWETVRSGRFSMESAAAAIKVMEKSMEIALVGLRDQDLLASGFRSPPDSKDRREALIGLAVATLSAELDAASALLAIAREETESAGMALAELTVRAPVSGIIGARYFEEGERIKREDKVLTVMDVGSLYAIAPIRESEALRVTAGMEAAITVDSLAHTWRGTVASVAPVADSGSATFSVKVLLSDAEERLKPGMFARMTITAGADRDVLVVPETSLKEKNGDSGSLFVIMEGKLSARAVHLGVSLEENRVVVSGLTEGEVVVDKPAPGLKEGERVELAD